MLQGEAPHHHHRKQSAWTKYIYTMYSKLQSQLGSLIGFRAKWLDFYGQTSLELHVRVCHRNVIAIDSPSAQVFKKRKKRRTMISLSLAWIFT
ncbi:Os04g0469700 [Oryza sativa Japonica Group]|uniref:Os04g0469700 protein n=2 Tax=Oryza sativa subsp. japonica TaxID=39947 RepID=Q0JCH7_ORYSJ|nr:hypothetical protein EE612_023854 [Oryza sativa]BAF14960.1 Os04g0469700 [Oryza sativa Japonica Group]BAS89631.1 Os04g0469700 [Oryza sativa Japonica Group]|eukprot:NP_001053046.1 Os04g0469700 [Oryza sativa Japonica Group]